MTTFENLSVLWDYLIRKDEIKESDIIIGFGSNDISVAKRSAQLFLEKKAPMILFTGGLGRGTEGNWKKTEAETFCEIAVDLGVPRDNILIENKSSNTGENIRFTRDMLKEHSINVHLATIVHQPNMGRRIFAAMKKQWPEIEIQITASNYSLEKHINDLLCTGVDRYEIYSNIVADLQRIDIFAKEGYQIEQHIPDNVMNAYIELCNEGYTKYLINK